MLGNHNGFSESDETNPIEANVKPRLQFRNGEICHRRRFAGDETNPTKTAKSQEGGYASSMGVPPMFFN
jgi:hypothetical protein